MSIAAYLNAYFSASGFNFVGVALESTNIPASFTVSWGDGSTDVVDAPFGGAASAFHDFEPGTYSIIVNDRPNLPETPAVRLMAYLDSGQTAALNVKGTGFADIVLTGSGDDVVTTGAGNDWISGGSGGNDKILSGDGNDVLFGDAGDDILNGGDGDDLIGGGDGNDHIFGGAGADTVFADDGDDVVRAGDGDDHVEGGAGNDVLYGDAGNDFILGGAGNDRLVGGDGDDYLYGGGGQNVLTGGSGADTFAVILNAEEVAALDTIADFSGFAGEGDVIDLSNVAVQAGVTNLTFMGTERFDGGIGEVRYFTNAAGNTIVNVDINGDRYSDVSVVLRGIHTLVEQDFNLAGLIMV